MWYSRNWYFPRSRPRAARGGIKAQSKRGSFGQTWWAKRWIAVLESFQIGARLGRGRSYARNGQVLSIDIDKGQVKAKVQGSRPKPYDITIQVKELDEAEWQQLGESLSCQALFVAKLLANEMPQEIEQVFTEVGLSLFPSRLDDLATACSCPDWSNPCKHIAAVYYLLGEEFDRDPFLLFKLRGLSREELLEVLHRREAECSPETEPAPPQTAVTPPEPLAAEGTRFWKGGDVPGDLFGEVHVPPVVAALPKRLGSFPFWRGAERFLDALEPVYRQASQRGLEIFVSDAGREEASRR